ncbi:MAG: hypothetical protein WCF99_16160 [Chloroflexales bacterium]
MTTIKDGTIVGLEILDASQRTENPLAVEDAVLAFGRSLAIPQGTPGHQLLAFAGVIDPDDIATMSQMIAQDCESRGTEAPG